MAPSTAITNFSFLLRGEINETHKRDISKNVSLDISNVYGGSCNRTNSSIKRIGRSCSLSGVAEASVDDIYHAG